MEHGFPKIRRLQTMIFAPMAPLRITVSTSIYGLSRKRNYYHIECLDRFSYLDKI